MYNVDKPKIIKLQCCYITLCDSEPFQIHARRNLYPV